MEFDAARWVFEQLGAAPDLARAQALAGARPAGGRADGARAGGAAPGRVRQDQPGRSPPTCSSARRPWPATSATSSPSWACRPAPRPPPTPTSTTSSSAPTQNHPRRQAARLGVSPEAARPPLRSVEHDPVKVAKSPPTAERRRGSTRSRKRSLRRGSAGEPTSRRPPPRFADWMVREPAPVPGDTVLELAAGAGDTGFEAAAAPRRGRPADLHRLRARDGRCRAPPWCRARARERRLPASSTPSGSTSTPIRSTACSAATATC